MCFCVCFCLYFFFIYTLILLSSTFSSVLHNMELHGSNYFLQPRTVSANNLFIYNIFLYFTNCFPFCIMESTEPAHLPSLNFMSFVMLLHNCLFSPVSNPSFFYDGSRGLLYNVPDDTHCLIFAVLLYCLRRME